MGAALLLLTLIVVGTSESARILVAIPYPSISHQTPFRPIALELARRGHDVTIITTDPMRRNITNYTEIDVSPAYGFLKNSVDWMEFAKREWNAVETWHAIADLSLHVCEDSLNSPELSTFLKLRPKFDLCILQRLFMPCYYGLQHAVGSPPIIGYVSASAFSSVFYTHRNPNNPAYHPQWSLPYAGHMSFRQRLYNTYMWLYVQFIWFRTILPQHEEISRKYFGFQGPSVEEVEKNFTLTIINNHFSLSFPRANLPTIVEVTGLQVERETKPLPQDIQDWLDGATAGVIYFSLGTNVKVGSISDEKRRVFLDAFAELPQRVLCKWDAEEATDLPPNVKVSKWMPQQSILAHPNIKAFITQGGIQSFNEAAYHGIPLIGMPVLGDQLQNVAKIVSAGVGVKLEIRFATKATISKAVREVIENQRYRENMKLLSAMYREHQDESLQKAVWWIEYVLRHNGAPQLRSAALDLSWHQLLLLDVVAFVLVGTVVSGYVTYVLARFLISFLRKDSKQKSH